MKSLKNSLIKVKNHYKQNKFGYWMSFVAIGAIALQQRNRISFYAFLEEKGIDPEEFYTPEYFAEKNS